MILCVIDGNRDTTFHIHVSGCVAYHLDGTHSIPYPDVIYYTSHETQLCFIHCLVAQHM